MLLWRVMKRFLKILSDVCFQNFGPAIYNVHCFIALPGWFGAVRTKFQFPIAVHLFILMATIASREHGKTNHAPALLLYGATTQGLTWYNYCLTFYLSYQSIILEQTNVNNMFTFLSVSRWHHWRVHVMACGITWSFWDHKNTIIFDRCY